MFSAETIALFLIGLSLLGMEFASPGLYLGAMGLGAVAAAMVDQSYGPLAAVITFVIFTAVFSAFLWKRYRTISLKKSPLIGRKGKVISIIGPKMGKIRVGKDAWMAKFDKSLKKGDKVEVERLEGVILVVKRAK